MFKFYFLKRLKNLPDLKVKLLQKVEKVKNLLGLKD